MSHISQHIRNRVSLDDIVGNSQAYSTVEDIDGYSAHIVCDDYEIKEYMYGEWIHDIYSVAAPVASVKDSVYTYVYCIKRQEVRDFFLSVPKFIKGARVKGSLHLLVRQIRSLSFPVCHCEVLDITSDGNVIHMSKTMNRKSEGMNNRAWWSRLMDKFCDLLQKSGHSSTLELQEGDDSHTLDTEYGLCLSINTWWRNCYQQII